MTGENQSDIERLSFDTAMEPRLTGKKGIGASPGGVFQEIVAGPAGDSQTHNLPIEVAGGTHGCRAQCLAHVACELYQRLRFAQPAHAAGAAEELTAESGSCSGYTSIAGSS